MLAYRKETARRTCTFSTFYLLYGHAAPGELDEPDEPNKILGIVP